MSGFQWTALQGPGRIAPAWEMLRVLRSDPSPQHKNADTWLREDTRGWGPAPLNPKLPERSELSKEPRSLRKSMGSRRPAAARPRQGKRKATAHDSSGSEAPEGRPSGSPSKPGAPGSLLTQTWVLLTPHPPQAEPGPLGLTGGFRPDARGCGRAHEPTRPRCRE